MAEVIALFPLSHVLLPGMPLPLHIFEQRYRDLLTDIAATPSGPTFGVVALRSGTEAATAHTVASRPSPDRPLGDGPDVEAIGTLAEILEVEGREDGTSDVLSVGSRRFRIRRLIPEGRPYLRAEVEFLPEPDGAVTPDLEAGARALIELYDAMLVKLAGRGTGTELPADANQLSYQLASRLPLPPRERQALLVDETTADRLDRIGRLLRRELALLQRTRTIAVSPAVLRMVAGTN